MKISFITTVFNEEKTLRKFLDSLLAQSKLPDEIIIVDGGSRDATVASIKKQVSSIREGRLKRIKFKVLVKRGNRSVGRNEAIRNATGDVIVCTDAGNILDKDWIKNIIKPFKDKSVDVVAGYYKGRAKNVFQKCLIPYVLVMPDKVNPDNFLPATRSVAFTKQIWKKAGGFDEQLSHNEDYAFAQKLKEKKAKIVFAKDAIVNWIPRTTFKEAFTMFWRFAFGDAEAGIWRTSVILLFARYFLGLYFIFLSLLYKSVVPFAILFVAFVAYIFWSIKKNYHYVNQKKARVILPLLQFIADVAVLSGTLMGAWKRFVRFNYLSYIKNNKFLFFVLIAYVCTTLLTLGWGIPNQQHPFPYHMDEWHQLQAVANTFRYGTPNMEGSANGTMFHFLLSGFYLIPFVLFQIVDPFQLQISNLLMREKIFIILRLQTIIFGILSIITLYKIAELLSISKQLVIVFFTFTPLWLILSGYFKYDIALLFWILLALYAILFFSKRQTDKRFLFAAIPVGLAVAVKISALPILFIYYFAFFLFQKRSLWNIRILLLSFFIILSICLLFGFPDTLFGKGNILYYLYDNILDTPSQTGKYLLGTNVYNYLFLTHYPQVFGWGLFVLSIISLVFFSYTFLLQGIKKTLSLYKNEVFLFVSFCVFLLSILPLKLFASGNRSLVLLPFITLLIGLFLKRISRRIDKKIIAGLIIIMFGIQILQSFIWVSFKTTENPRRVSSEWIMTSLEQGTVIGLENIPIYQHIPDVIQKEFYFHQYGLNNTTFEYLVIDADTKILPPVIIVTNDAVEKQLFTESPKLALLDRLADEGYQKVVTFSPDTRYFQKIGNDIDFFITNVVPEALTISVYKK